jgi:hypothetical protein
LQYHVIEVEDARNENDVRRLPTVGHAASTLNDGSYKIHGRVLTRRDLSL